MKMENTKFFLSNWEFFVWNWEKNIPFGIRNGAKFWPQKRMIESTERAGPYDTDGFYEYPQHMFWLRNKKTIFLLRTFNCPYLECEK